MSLIELSHIIKHFQILNRKQGLMGAFKDLFSNDYRLVKAVEDVSLNIEAGEIVGYIGPNGAGKSTTIKMMTGILKPTSGRITVDGSVPYENRKKNAQNMGVIFGQRTQLWWDLPVIESFKILKAIYRVDDQTYERQLGLFNELIDLKALYGTPTRQLSLGQRMLCDITAAFLHNPKAVFLDEPTIGLDISVKSKIRAVIKELNEARLTTIILTTHDLGDVEALCKRLMIIDKGLIIYDGDITKVTRMFGAYRTLKVQIAGYNEMTLETIKATLQSRFDGKAGSGALTVDSTEAGWTDVMVNQDHIPLLDVLSLLMKEFTIQDVRILEIPMESVVQKIYDGALK
jgi:ABC-type uncharacterized transport system ATPase subunit